MNTDDYEFIETYATDTADAPLGGEVAIVPDGTGWELHETKRFGTMIVYVWRRPMQQQVESRRVSVR